ncbi:MAG: T9SS type A sorting domain-containing protein, partial [Elusimicrobia bacterium]|nr:T9SS type A sorting domain-containing protein [Elusimicrobiota bacterium]
GQFGAISEALADYFAASSLDLSTIGGYTAATFGHGSLRELDCPARTACVLYPTNWSGTIHEDSRMVSQALWAIRQGMVTTLGAANGKKCADRLTFGALFYYPDSFADFERAMLALSARSAAAVPACGANSSQNGLIQARFADHGITTGTGDLDAYEPNDGMASAVDITTASAVVGRVYPAGDLDYFALGAGPGRMTLSLTLPESASSPGSYSALALTLIDRSFNVVATQVATLDVNPTLGGNCPESNCLSSRRTVTLNYDNPAANQFYLLVSAPQGDESAVSNNSSTRFYSLSASYPRGPVAAGIVAASFDRDSIDFSVVVSTFVRDQAYHFSYAQLRDHNHAVLAGTRTDEVSPYLTLTSSSSAAGLVTGRVRLANSFTARYPAVGTVHLEVFGVSLLGHTQTLGESTALALTAAGTSMTAYNNLFNPAVGEKATIKWETQGAGHVRLRLFTIAGQQVATLLDEDRPAGKGAVDWAGVNSVGQRVASGVYLLHIEAPGLEETKKIVVVK